MTREQMREKILSHVQYDTNGGCWLWSMCIGNHGYGKVCKGKKNFLAHRESYKAFVGDPGDKLVCHTCDVRSCVNPAHLWLGTNAENLADMAAKGRSRPSLVSGADHPHAKLTVTDVLSIRARTDSARAIAAEYGVAEETIRKARVGASWKSLSTKEAILKARATQEQG